MSSVKVLRRRIKSVGNTRQITKAMELVAASKLKKVQTKAVASKRYSELAYELLHRISSNSDTKQHPYFSVNVTSKRRLVLVFASDKGLAGPFLGGIANQVFSYIEQHHTSSELDIIVIGKRAAHYFAKMKSVNLIAVYDHFADIPDPQDFSSILKIIDSGIVDGKYSDISIVYSEFISTSLVKPKVVSVYPLSSPVQETQSDKAEVFDFEPSADEILSEAARLYIQSQLFQAKLDSAASEHAMRMIAMHAASDNASDLIKDFQLDLNTTRQSMVTSQMAEISGALAALL